MNVSTFMELDKVPDHVPPELVVDWTFNNPGGEIDPFGTLAPLSGGPDIVFSPRGRRGAGSWIVKRYDLISEIMMNAELFSNDRYSGFSAVLGEDWPMIPLEVDPPLHQPFRIMMNKVFAASRITLLSEKIEVMVREMTEAVRDAGECDFQAALGRRLPTTVILELVGLPVEHADMFLAWEEVQMRSGDMADRKVAARKIADYLIAAVTDRAANPRDDLLTYIAQAEVFGRPLTDTEKLGIAYLLYSAGLDTVAASMGFIFRFLAENADVQERLRDEPDLRPRAIEELLRLHSVAMPGRIVTRDMEFHGVPMKKGDYVTLPLMMAGRDARMFADPEVMNPARANANRHLAFGTGPHNCMGSHLARRELKVALDYWLDRMPAFRMGDLSKLRAHDGTVFGIDDLPLVWR